MEFLGISKDSRELIYLEKLGLVFQTDSHLWGRLDREESISLYGIILPWKGIGREQNLYLCTYSPMALSEF